MTLYLLNFNNYYNRIVKRYDTLQEYIDTTEILDIIDGVNFNPNNGISTEQIINYTESKNPNYVLIVDEYGNLVSRWFIIDSARTRAQQFKISLYRDVIADWYNEIINQPCFIEKAILSDNDKMIFNNESMTYNQIKQHEIPLVDNSGCSWIVGYFNRKPDPVEGEAAPEEINIDVIDEPYHDEIINSSFDKWEYHDLFTRTSPYRVVNKNDIDIYSFFSIKQFQNAVHNIIAVGNTKLSYTDDNRPFSSWSDTVGVSNSNTQIYEDLYKKSYNTSTLPAGYATAQDFFLNKTRPYNIDNYDDFPDFFNPTELAEIQRLIKSGNDDIIFNDDYAELMKYNNKVVKFNTGDPSTTKYIKIEIPATEYQGYSRYIPISVGLNSYMSTAQAENTSQGIDLRNRSSFLLTSSYTTAKPCKYQELEFTRYIVKFPEVRNHPQDAPYDVFCIPYGIPENSKNVVNINGNPVNKQMALIVAQEIIRKYAGGGIVYDVQLLPYFPIDSLIDKTLNQITINPGDDKTSVAIKDADDIEKGRIFFPYTTTFTKNIDFVYEIDNVKISSETEFMRLVSPNYNGQFEFSPAKNGGLLYFNIDCTYKPYTPYIHINPNFNYLYGGDFNDSRGLICGGDFSLTMMNDAWETYQIQNKNYQNIFDRQIENMNTNNSIQRQLEWINLITGTVSGGASGGMTGGMVGGGAGGAAGAIVGAGASFAGGLADIYFNEQLRTEAMNYTQDLFGYNLGNVKALPQSIIKTSALTFNNKVFPILEIFGCTQIEKKALAEKICYNSMTVMRIGNLNEFMLNKWKWTAEDGTKYESKGYIKAKLIRLENISEDFQIINQISNELYKGVYI